MSTETSVANVLTAALAAWDAGLCVLPTQENGSKAPRPERLTFAQLVDLVGPDVALEISPQQKDGSFWKHRLHRQYTRDEIERWYAGGHTGLGVATGSASKNTDGLGLEVLEFDDLDTFQVFMDTAESTEMLDLVDRITSGYHEATPGGGVHLPYYCPTIEGNTKLAQRPGNPDENGHPTVKTLIETRGEGGYIVLAPSCGRVHLNGKPYRVLAGSLGTIATITSEERESLFGLARAFDEMPKMTDSDPAPPSPNGTPGDRPGDRFNAVADWREILEPHGFRFIGERNGTGLWTRPGKAVGVSATTNHAGSGLLYVFSTSTVFEAERGYSPFSAYALLNYGGDFSAAAKALAAETNHVSHSADMNGNGRGSLTDTVPHVAVSQVKGPSTVGNNFHLTDQGNAQRFVARHGHHVRYCYPMKSWFYWGGKRWRLDDSGAIERLAKETARSIYDEVSRIDDPEDRKKMAKHALSSESRRAIEAMIALSCSDVSVLPKDLDSDPWLLNVANGTIDLRTGQLREHDPADMITKLSPVAYDPDAESPIWTRYLTTATGGDLAYIGFLQRAAGYSLTGEPSEECIFFLHGPSKSGKTTFIEAIKAALGDYAVTSDFETWLARRDPGGPRQDLRALPARDWLRVWKSTRVSNSPKA
ncbi:MAG TPA: bifunctional DNA primase/polymerase [Chloroflexota bacterium]|nr:bifunctional DNA primase/polymerase [Chloroflexota bacterium]